MKYILLVMLFVIVPLVAAVDLHPRSQEFSDMIEPLNTSALGDKVINVYVDNQFSGCLTTGEDTEVVLEECDAGFNAFMSEEAVNTLAESEDPLATYYELKKAKEIKLVGIGVGNKIKVLGMNIGLTFGKLFRMF